MPMPHLSPDRLAELSDSVASAAELAHLAACSWCAAELDAHRRVLTVAHLERERLMPPLTQWDSLAPVLRSEGLIRDARTPESRQWQRWMRLAAAAVLMAGGVVVGRTTVGVGDAVGSQVVSAVRERLRPVSRNSAAPQRSFRNSDEAIAALSEAQVTYQRAIAYLASQGPGGAGNLQEPETYQRRIAALDDIAGAVRAALYRAPDDPVVNQAYLRTMGERATALRQLGTAMPVGTRLASY